MKTNLQPTSDNIFIGDFHSKQSRKARTEKAKEKIVELIIIRKIQQIQKMIVVRFVLNPLGSNAEAWILMKF
jgi:hypothetical protein